MSSAAASPARDALLTSVEGTSGDHRSFSLLRGTHQPSQASYNSRHVISTRGVSVAATRTALSHCCSNGLIPVCSAPQYPLPSHVMSFFPPCQPQPDKCKYHT